MQINYIHTLTLVCSCTIIIASARTGVPVPFPPSLSSVVVSGGGQRLPEPSSTLLKMQRIYSREPPHDTSLYDTLHVAPNATVAEISKAYRYLSRELHPDKRRQYWKRKQRRRKEELSTGTANDMTKVLSEESEEESEEATDADEELERVRQAYDVLKEDTTRCVRSLYIYIYIYCVALDRSVCFTRFQCRTHAFLLGQFVMSIMLPLFI